MQVSSSQGEHIDRILRRYVSVYRKEECTNYQKALLDVLPSPSTIGHHSEDNILEHDTKFNRLLHPTQVMTSDAPLRKLQDCNSVKREAMFYLSSDFEPDEIDPRHSATPKSNIAYATNTSPSSQTEQPSSKEPREAVKANGCFARLSKQQNTLKREHERTAREPSHFSTTTALNNFLELRSRKPKKPRFTEHTKAKDETDNSHPIHTSVPAVPTPSVQSVQIPAILDPENLTLSRPCSIIINTDLLQHHSSLVRFLETKQVNMIYRDFKPFEPHPQIIIDAKTCIFTTNTQSLIQRSLPGQKTNMFSPLTTIESLTRSFEVIYIMVLHHLDQTQIQARSDMDTDIMNHLAGFCASFTPDVKVHPIWIQYTSPANLSDLLNAYTWSLIAKHNSEDKYTLIQEETKWELFLRQAGFNCFAAQVILSTLSEGDSTSSSGIRSLPLFILMSASERSEMFSGLLGSRIVDRVSRILDG